MYKPYVKIFLLALMFALTGVAWIHMQSVALSPSEPQAIYQLAKNRMLVDGIQTIFCTVLIWWIVARSSKKHVPIRGFAISGLLFKGCLWFTYIFTLLVMLGGVLASMFGFSSENFTQSDLVEWNNDNRHIIVVTGSLLWGLVLLWACFAFSVMSVRQQIKSLPSASRGLHLQAPLFWQVLAGFDAVFSPWKSPKLWLFFLIIFLLKVLTWYLNSSGVSSLVFIGNLLSMMLPVCFIILMEMCFLALSDDRFSRLKSEQQQVVAI